MEPFAQAHLMVVEDLNSDQQLIRIALEELGFQGQTTYLSSGEGLLEYFFAEPRAEPLVLPDLILLDLSLSDMNGKVLLDRLKQTPQTAATPVVIFSSMQSEATSGECYALGAGGFVQKPTDFDELKARLSATFSFWFQPSIKRGSGLRGTKA